MEPLSSSYNHLADHLLNKCESKPNEKINPNYCWNTCVIISSYSNSLYDDGQHARTTV